MKRKLNTNEIDKVGLNNVIDLSKKILKLFYFLMIVGVIFLITLVCKEWGIVKFIITLLAICAPLFIGFVIAWLFNPLVSWLEKKGMRRIWGSILIFVTLISLMYLLIITLIPTMNSQLKDLIAIIPKTYNSFKDFIAGLLDNLNHLDGVNTIDFQEKLFTMIEGYFDNFTTDLPNAILSIVSSLFSGLGTFIVSMIIGFYMLLNFNSISHHVLNLFPKKFRYEVDTLLTKISIQLYNFVQGTLITSLLIFVVCAIGFWIVGLKAPVLFALFCGITNIIPYIGPYIGAVPALVVGFSQDPIIGVLSGIIIIVVQTIEGNLIHPLVMSKKMSMHPVTIMIGLIVFGHFWGILGMILAMPIIAFCKIIGEFIITKFDLFSESEDFLTSDIKITGHPKEKK